MNSSEFDRAQKLRDNGRIDEAVDLYNTIREQNLISNPRLASECLHMMGVAYYQIGKFEKADVYLNQALEEFTGDREEEFAAFVLRDLGASARGQKDFIKAKEHLNQSIQKLHKLGNKGHEGMTRVKLGRVIADEGNFNSAIIEINLGISLLKDSKEEFFLSSSYLDRAKVYLQYNHKHDARLDLEKSLNLLNGFSGPNEFLSRRKDIEELLVETNE